MAEVRYEFEEGKLQVFTRPGSRFWQARIRIDGAYQFKSLKTTDEHKAIVSAKEWYQEQTWARKHGLPTKVRYMKDLIIDFQKHYEDRKKSGITSKHMAYLYKHQSGNVINDYFGDKQVHAIKDQHIAEYIEWRMNGDPKPARQTLSMELQCLRKIFEFAARKNLILKGEIPSARIPKMHHLAAGRRPAFSREEWNTLWEKLRDWPAQTNHASIQYRRRLLFAYFEIMGATGMRTNDAWKLKWKHIVSFTQNGRDYVEITAFGKPTSGKPSRTLTGQPHAFNAIWLWRKRSKFTDPDDFVFCYTKGVAWDPKHMFREALETFGLLKDPITGENRTPYSIRHTYATFRLESGVPIHLIARQMGTSVGMIEKHYGHVNLRKEVAKLAQKKNIPDEVWMKDL